MTAKEIVNKYIRTIELHASSAAYAITPTLVNFYRESLEDAVTLRNYYVLALEEAIDEALKAEPQKDGEGKLFRYGEYTFLFRFKAKVRMYDDVFSFDFDFALNGGLLQR